MVNAITAEAQLQGGMIALRLKDPSKVLFADGEPREQLHMTLAIVAETASDLDEAAREATHRAAGEAAAAFGEIEATIAGFAVLGTDDPPGVVLVLNGLELAPVRDVVWAELNDYGSEAFPPQHEPFIAHITVGYGLDIQANEDRLRSLVGEAVLFDNVSVDLGGEQSLYSLRTSVTAAPRSRQRVHGGGKFESERQRRYMWSQCPKAARKWAHNLKTRPSDWRGCRIQTRPGIGMVSDGSIGGTMAKLVIEIDHEKIPELMEQLLGNGMVETMEVADVEDDEEAVKADSYSVAVAASLSQLGEDYRPPSEFFADPKFEAPQRWTTVTSDGRVMGHLALWGECHIGYPNQCITPEMITDGGFDYANGIGHVVSADGEQVGTSPLPIKGGHAPIEWDWKRAKAHYDDPSSGVADVVYGADDHGIWFSGALRPDATDDKVHAIRASGVSGDWRKIDGKLRLLAGCCVNNGGFPKMSARMNLAASGELHSAIAIGGDPEADPTLEEDCGCHESVTADVEVSRLDAIERQLAKLEVYIRPQILASLREKLAANE